jgi:benzoate membrane transport protein
MQTFANFGSVAIPRTTRSTLLADINAANISAGVTAGLFYLFGAVPIFLGATAAMGLSPAAVSSWFFITFMTSALSGLFLSVKYRLPIPVGWTMPGLVFLASAGGSYTHAEMMGAVLMAGVVIIALGLAGVGEQLMRLLPLPIVMGMFAGNMLSYQTGIFSQLQAQPLVVGAAIGGYLATRAFGRLWLPPMAGAVLAGMVAAGLTGQVDPGAFAWQPPTVAPVRPELDPGSILALSLPLVVLAIGLGNVQGLGMLVVQGFRPPVRLITIWMGVTTLINAVFGGHVSAIQNNGVAILGGADAGPRASRYMANVVAALIALFLGVCAATVGSLLGILPDGFVPALAGLALMSAMLDALQKAIKTDLAMGAFFALIIASSSLSILGIGAALWALVGGVLVSLVLERPALLRSWTAAEAPA